MIDIKKINSLDKSEFLSIFGNVFEKSKWISEKVFDKKPFKNLESFVSELVTCRTFFHKAKINPNAHLIKGVVCGYRIEEIDDEFELYKQCRQLEKLIDELAKGRKMEKILREEKK